MYINWLKVVFAKSIKKIKNIYILVTEIRANILETNPEVLSLCLRPSYALFGLCFPKIDSFWLVEQKNDLANDTNSVICKFWLFKP